MLVNKAIAATVLAALAEQTAAANVHRHLHQEVQKRAVDVEWVTVWETVYVTAGQDPAPTEGLSVEGGDNGDKGHVKHNRPAPEPTTTSTTSIVVPPTTQAPVAVQTSQPPPAAAPAPAPVYTTLTTSAKPAPKPSAQPEPVVEDPPVVNPVQPTTSKQAPAPKPTTVETPSDGSPFSGKRGLAYNDGNLANVFGNSCEGCGWGYNWGSARQGLDEKFEYVPMLWGDKAEFTGYWDTNCEDALSSGSKAIFSFNEPDNGGQANLQPGAAAVAHAKYLNKYQGRAHIGSPSVTNGGGPNEGLQWLKQFMDACDAQEGGCAVDFCNVHWYSPIQYVDTLFDHLEEAHKVCGGKPIWLTEFAPYGTEDEIAGFMKTVIPKLESLEYLHAYSYFMVATGTLMSSESTLSGYGQLYASV
ncbi:hypothetical protein ACO1O0_006336 [Amphichorda felina]